MAEEHKSTSREEDDADLAAQRQHLQERSRRRAELRGQRLRRQMTALGATSVVALVMGILVYIGLQRSIQAGTAAKMPASAVIEAGARRMKTVAAQVRARRRRAGGPSDGSPGEIVIVVAGDMIFDRRVRDLMQSDGTDAPFSGVTALLKDADVTLANLESPLSNRGSPWAGKDVTFRGTPAGASAIKSAGIDAVSMANNHALDYGREALVDTIANLDRAKVKHAGAGRDLTEAFRPAWIHVGKRKVAFLAFSWIVPNGFYPSATGAGVAGTRDPAVVSRAVRQVARRADFTVVSFHWGMEYQDYPLQDQVALAHAAIDAGASLVMGHHPHVIQGIELYRRRPIVYSLGDFVFDHYSRKTGEAFLFKARIRGRRLLGARVTPVYLSWSGQPQPVGGSEGAQILGRLQEISARFGTKLVLRGDYATLRGR